MSTPATTERLAGLLAKHREDALTCYDHLPTRDRPCWCCVCGAHELTVSWRTHVAEILAAFVAEAQAEALREAADDVPLFEFMLVMDIASEVAPAQIAGWLRARADRIGAGDQ